jgi:hypothetical protein
MLADTHYLPHANATYGCKTPLNMAKTSILGVVIHERVNGMTSFETLETCITLAAKVM